ncbi:MAG: hypothetical protein HY356_01455 [Gammaproteobacteria bacterium]|nr:hypothetical protein [Gammaproteobacteria bacterium]
MFKLKLVILLATAAFIISACGESDAPVEQGSPAMTETAPASVPAQEQTQVTPPEPVVEETITPQEPEAEAVTDKGVQRAETPPPAVEEMQQVVTEATPQTEPVSEPVAEEPAVTNEAPATAITIAAAGPPKTHTINAEARVFNPDIIYIQPGDTISWINMTSHNTVSVDGLIPEGATPWRGQLGENLKVTLEKEGVYAYVCEPHIGFGMVGVIVVGKPANLEDVKAYADKNLQGPFRRIISKLNKVAIQ